MMLGWCEGLRQEKGLRQRWSEQRQGWKGHREGPYYRKYVAPAREVGRSEYYQNF